MALILFYLVKKIAFDIVKVNNHDMAATYQLGDAVLVKKIGNQYKVADVVYFEYPLEDSLIRKTFMFQRIVGLPGDSVKIEDKIIYRNTTELQDDGELKHNYFVRTKGKHPDSLFQTRFNIHEGGLVSDSFDYSFALTPAQVQQLRRDSLIIKRVLLKRQQKNNFDENCFPYSTDFKWNRDYYGAIYIPRRNDTLKLDSVSIKLYFDLIAHHENNQVELRQDSILINGDLSTSYVVKRNYYFVLGDNRDNANDSRVWGYLPENNIVGKISALIKRR